MNTTSSPHLKLLGLVLLAVAAIPAGLAQAQDGDLSRFDELSELSLEELLGVTSTASGRSESLFRAPATVTVLERSDIRASGARTIPDLLRRVPGVQVFRSAPGAYVVSLRGAGSLAGNNVLVLLDDTPVNNEIDAEIDWGLLPVHLDQVHRIEVVRGPVSPIYGANAYTGVINITTRPLPEADGLSGAGGGGFQIDSNGDVAGLARASVQGRHGATAWGMSAYGTIDNTWSELDGADQPKLRGAGVAGRLRLSLAEDIDLTVQATAATNDRAALDHFVLEPGAQNTSMVSGRVALSLRNLSSAVDELRISYQGRWFQRGADRNQLTGFNYDGTEAVNGRMDVQFKLKPVEALNVVAGVQGTAARVEAPYLHPEENAVIRLGVGVYASADLDVSDMVVLGAAVRVDDADFTDDPQVSVRGSAVLYQPSYSLRLAAGTAYRFPTYLEVGSRFTDPDSSLIVLEGTGGLNFPRVEAIEFGAAVLATGRLTLRPTLYLARMSDLISGDFTPLVRKTFQNAGESASILGGELEAEWELSDEITLGAAASGLIFLSEDESEGAAIGVGRHNSRLTAWLGGQAEIIPGVLEAAGGLTFMSERDYNLRAGIPPQLITQSIPNLLRIDASLNWRPIDSLPLWAQLRVVTHAPHDVAESPLTAASQLGTTAFLGVELRPATSGERNTTTTASRLKTPSKD